MDLNLIPIQFTIVLSISNRSTGDNAVHRSDKQTAVNFTGGRKTSEPCVSCRFRKYLSTDYLKKCEVCIV